MTHKSLPTLSIAFASILTLSACNNTPVNNSESSKASPVVLSTATSPQHNAHPSWSYAGESGPNHWGDIEGNEQCNIGKEQSPINITKAVQSSDDAPKPNYLPSDIEIENNGHTIVYTPQNGNNTTIIDGESYTLKQFHYHIPSEHQISGVNYPGEIHFVNANKKGELAVIGVMLNPTAVNNTNLQPLLINSFNDTSTHKTILNAFELSTLLPENPTFYNYAGSLTTPPCSEHVKWFVATKPLSISQQEIQLMKQLYNGNNRPIRPIGNRDVKLVK